MGEGDNKQMVDRSGEAVEYARSLGIDALICIGGDGTLSIADGFRDRGLKVVGIPKTIDNDLYETDQTFGFDTAVSVATEAIDRIHSTAESHHRVMLVEVMGRNAGWLALHSGIAGGGDIILLPEIPYDIDKICEKILWRNRNNRRFSIVMVSEGAKPIGGEAVVARIEEDSPDPIRLGGVSNVVAAAISTEEGAFLRGQVTMEEHVEVGQEVSPEADHLDAEQGVE